MITWLKMKAHSVTGQPMVEVYTGNGNMVACIYAGSDDAIHIVSKHFADDPIKPSEGDPPGYIVRFKPK
jgi:hypothetical protein